MKGIVVGVDGSEGSRHALEWAAAEARLRGVPLTALLAWQLPAVLFEGAAWGAITPDLMGELETVAEQRLAEACAAVAPALDGLDITQMVAEGASAEALVEAAKDAELLVVGTRGHGGFAGLLLGSVSQQCAHHSPSPIVIVPAPEH